MNFDLTEEQQLIARTAADYGAKRLAPNAAARDRESTFPLEECSELGELGLLGINIPEKFGGAEAGVVAYSLALTELAAADASVAVAVSVTNMVAELISSFGSEQQKTEHVPKLVSGEYIAGSFALSEPEVGSDPASLATRAEKVDGGYRLSGTKQWVTSGDHAKLIVVWARTGEAKSGHRGLSAFLVRNGAVGLTMTRREEKMGLHGSSTVQLHFDGVEVSGGDVLGEVGDGFKLAMVALDGGRIGIASQAIGIARMALAAAVNYARDRKTFGKPIITHQAIGNMLADAATWLETARLMVMSAAQRKEKKQPFSKQASMAKLFATERANMICDIALQVHGGYGYTTDFPVERALRDVRVTRIYEGTSEIQRLVIARTLIKEATR